MQIDSLSRQLDTERAGRGRIATERDELREKLKLPAVAKDVGHEETRPYQLDALRGTQPEVAAIVIPSEWSDEPTQVQPVHIPQRAPVKTDPLYPARPPVKTDPKKGK